MTRSSWLLCMVFIVFAAGGCDDMAPVDPVTDAGREATSDAGPETAMDAGARPDEDAGPGLDAGPAEPVIRLVVRVVETEDYNTFVTAYSEYEAALDAESGVDDRRLLRSFFSGSDPTIPSARIGLTELVAYESEAAYDTAISGSLAPAEAALEAVSTSESDLLVRLEDGSTDLSTFDGVALEIAVRSVAPENLAAYMESQAAFLEELDAIAGAITEEFELVRAPDGVHAAGFTTFSTPEALGQTFAYYQAMGPYEGETRPAAFFSTFELSSSQFGNLVPSLSPVLRLVVRVVDNADLPAFATAHAAYRAAIDADDGAGDRRLFQSFFSGTAPGVPATQTAITEIMEFDSTEHVSAATASLDTSALDAVSSVEADLLVRFRDGATDLSRLDGIALEIAVRSVPAENLDAYRAAQATFVEELESIEGATTQEFLIASGPTEVTAAGFTNFHVEAAQNQIFAYYQAMGPYAGDTRAADFFATFTLVASQFGSAVTDITP